MKNGFRVLLHKDIPQEYMSFAIATCDMFVSLGNSDKGYRTRRQCSRSFYQRGILGLEVAHTKRSLVFRRLVKNRRIFGVVPITELVKEDGSDVTLTGCICSNHDGGQRVNFRNGFRENDFVEYYETGDIKG